jgi:hypothetical protein
VISIVFPVFFSLFYFNSIYLAVLSFLAYGIVIFTISFSITWRDPFRIIYLFLAFLVLHTSYGFGSLVGIVRVFLLSRFKKRNFEA